MIALSRVVGRLLAAGLLFAAAGAGAAGQPVKIGSSVRSIFSLPLYVADQKGYFKDEGLDAEVIFFNGGPPATAALLGGSVQFISASLENQIKVNKRGETVQSVMTMQSDFSGALVIKKEIADKLGRAPTVADVKGLRVGTLARGGYADMAARYLFAKAGLDPDRDVSLIPVRGYDKVMAAAEEGSLDASLMVEPWQTLAVEGTGKWVYVVEMTRGQGPDVFQDMGYVTLQTTHAVSDGQPELTGKVVRALVKAEAYIREPGNIDDLVQVALKVFSNSDPGALKASIQKQQASFRPALHDDMLAKNMDLLIVNGVVSPPAPEPREAFAGRYAELLQ